MKSLLVSITVLLLTGSAQFSQPSIEPIHLNMGEQSAWMYYAYSTAAVQLKTSLLAQGARVQHGRGTILIKKISVAGLSESVNIRLNTGLKYELEDGSFVFRTFLNEKHEAAIRASEGHRGRDAVQIYVTSAGFNRRHHAITSTSENEVVLNWFSGLLAD